MTTACTKVTLLATLAAISLAATGYAQAVPAQRTPRAQSQRAPAAPSQRALTSAQRSADAWLLPNHGYAGWRYAPATQLTPANVAQLQRVCEVDLGATPPFQANPIVHRDVIYITTEASTLAISAADCRQQWRYDRMARDSTNYPQQRGVALKDGLVVRGTSDGYLVALRAADGTVAWERRVADAASGEAITMPIIAFEDLVFAGPAGSEFGAKGWIGAFKLQTGEPVWRFHTVPRAGEEELSTWGDASSVYGGGVWAAPSLDPARGELYVPVGSVAPPFNDDARPGDNLYTSSVVVLNARTGERLWYKQIVPHDTRNWDVTQAGPLFEATVAGRRRRIVAVSGKYGRLDAIDRATQEIVYSAEVTRVDSAGTPVEARRCPGPFGGVLYNGAAFSPRTNMLYVPAVDWCATVTKGASSPVVPRQFNWGGAFAFDSLPLARGRVTALDAATGTVKWRYLSSRPMIAAVTVTAGNVVFTGELTGEFIALDARDGRPLLSYPLGEPLGGGIVTYMQGKRQYVAVTSGTVGSFWRVSSSRSRLTLFALP